MDSYIKDADYMDQTRTAAQQGYFVSLGKKKREFTRTC